MVSIKKYQPKKKGNFHGNFTTSRRASRVPPISAFLPVPNLSAWRCVWGTLEMGEVWAVPVGISPLLSSPHSAVRGGKQIQKTKVKPLRVGSTTIMEDPICALF